MECQFLNDVVRMCDLYMLCMFCVPLCSSFLKSVCMFIVSKSLRISSATVIVRTGRAIWLNPFATAVLFTVCSAVTVECVRCVMDVMFSGCIVTHGAVAARVWEV